MFKRGLYRGPDGGNTGGDQSPAGDGQTGDGTGANTPNAGNTSVQFTPEQQQHIDAAIAERLKRDKEKWESDAKAAEEAARAEAEKERLKQEAKWKELAEQHEARVKELEPLEAQVAAYAEAVDELLKAKLAELGDAAKKAVEALPGTAGPLEKLSWLTANAELFKAGAGTTPGTPPRNKRQTTTSAGITPERDPDLPPRLTRF